MTYGRAGFPAGSSIDAIPTRQWQVVVSVRPIMKVLRRSIRSMLRSAMIPPMTATTPNAMLASTACFRSCLTPPAPGCRST